MTLDLFSEDARAPMTPARYIRLRREAAGLTIAQAAKPFYKREEHRADCEANLRTLEMPGVKAKPFLAETLPRAFPFDPSVYRQLCDEPPTRHPRLCRGCGCDRHNFCHTRDGAICTIGTDGVCTACVERVQAEAMRRAA